ncbi:anaerobic ribonucleoside-triphosphate reductase [Candidatus Woesearchaeota archaeon]|nr:anaerobic ribonucleoside-triphosphate reductase [Candidatus Woesearchaeota archaeon]
MAKCGKECEVFSRVVGYHRAVQQWNKGKKAEWNDRVEFDEKCSCSSGLGNRGRPRHPLETIST